MSLPRLRYVAPVLFITFGLGHAVDAATVNPVYFHTFNDHVTGTNEFVGANGTRRWFVSQGADSYQNEVYERPTIQSYQSIGGGPFSTHEYYQNLDIVRSSVGYDSTYLYISIEMFGRHRSHQGGNTLEGLKYEYGFRFSTDPDGRNGYLFRSSFSDPMSSPNFGLQKNLGYYDTDGDVGGRGGPLHGNPGPTGLNVTKEDNFLESVGMNGYNQSMMSDGVITWGSNVGMPLLYSRINPNNPSVVEFALNYTLLGMTLQDLLSIQYLDMQAIKGDPMDPQNYFWNDKYNKSEAGAPYYDPGGFGINGLGNIYELDTIRAAIPAPGALLVLGIGGLTLGRRRRA
jgi:hypothetical protein